MPRCICLFLLRVSGAGSGNRTRIFSYGDPWTAETARKKAQELFGEIARGKDPAQAKAAANSSAITVSRMIDMYLEEGPRDRPDKRQSSWDNDEGYLKNHARPLLGRRVIDEIKAADLAKFQNDVLNGKTARPKKPGRGRPVKGGKGAAVHAMRSLSAAFGWAVDRELLPVKSL